ncbi:MAG: phosphoglycerate kinase [Candidatus Babeliales bacterium]
MIVINSHLTSLPLYQKKVIVRADLNIPFCDKGKKIISDHKLKAIKPTIDYILKKGGTVILITHIGRPTKGEPFHSTALLLPWFYKHGYSIHHKTDLFPLDKNIHAPLILLENIRSFPGEKTNDIFFAQQLAQLGHYYVNDAFGSLHNHDTSLTLLPQLFSSQYRTIGFLVERELHQLHHLFHSPQRPLTLILGGKKIKTKLTILKTLLPLFDRILLTPALVFTLLKALKQSIGASLVDDASLELARNLLQHSSSNHFFFPRDYRVSLHDFSSPLLSYSVDADSLKDQLVGVTIGPKTESFFSDLISSSETILMNGLCGDACRVETLSGVASLLRTMCLSKKRTILAGGDTIGAAESLSFSTESFTYCSTGGGSLLAYLSSEHLPGLLPFVSKD